MIEELQSFSPADVQDMDRLMRELSETSSCDERRLGDIVGDENSHLYVIREVHRPGSGPTQEPSALQVGRIVGCACLCVAHSPEFTLGFVESVTVLEECRGKGYGRQMMEHLMAEARRLGVDRLHLTSSPRRVAANGLYRALGFVRHETNCYVMEVRVRPENL